MKILAVTLEKCSGCALLIDNEIVFSTSEERYSRIKSDASFPMQSISHALKFAKIEGSNKHCNQFVTSSFITCYIFSFK